MSIDEQTLAATLHAALDDLDPDADLGSRVIGLARARRRRRATTGLVLVLAVTALVVPIALPGGGATPRATLGALPSSNPTAPATVLPAPPTAASCTDGTGGTIAPSTVPDLLLLPSGVSSTASISATTDSCAGPHTALVAEHLAGTRVLQGLLVQGPDAPSPDQLHFHDVGEDCGCKVTTPQIRGSAAEVHALPAGEVEAWWNEAGGQWYARGTSTDVASVIGQLDRATLTDGLLDLAASDAQGWVDLHPAGSLPVTHAALLDDWHVGTVEVTLEVRQQPDVVDIEATLPAARVEQVSVNGRPGTYLEDPFNGGILVWQQQPGVMVHLRTSGLSLANLLQIANNLQPVPPTDPRLQQP